jgi:hypothetical protein
MAWYDPSDLSTLFQDAAGTTPVTASGQPVGLMLDKSGFGFHASQSTALARPTFTESGGRRYLVFDGVDDFLVTGTITPGSDKAQVFVGVRKLADNNGVVAEASVNSGANNGAIALYTGTTPTWGVTNRGTSALNVASPSSYASPLTNVLAAIYDISGLNTAIRANGSQVAQSSTSVGTGNYLAYPMYIGRRGGATLPFNGRIYSLIVRFATSNMTAAQIAQAEAWINQKTGAY